MNKFIDLTDDLAVNISFITDIKTWYYFNSSTEKSSSIGVWVSMSNGETHKIRGLSKEEVLEKVFNAEN